MSVSFNFKSEGRQGDMSTTEQLDGEGAWSWEKLRAQDENVLDWAWCSLMGEHWRAAEVPTESRHGVLDAGVRFWTKTARLNTSKLALLFNRTLNVCLVCKNFMAYRDAFLFGLSLAWGIEVPDLELAQPQSEAAFELCASLQDLERAAAGGHHHGGHVGTIDAGPSAGTQPGKVPAGGGIGADDEDGKEERGERDKWNRLTTRAVRSMRRRAGAPRWTIKLCKALESQLREDEEMGAEGPPPLAAKVWKILLDCDVTGADDLKAKMKEKRRKEKKKARRQRKKDRKRKGKGRAGKDNSSDSEDSSTSGSGTTSSSSSSSSGRSRGRRRRSPQRSTARHAGSSIAGRKEGEIWRGTGSAANTEFTLLNGRRHFKSKRTGAWEDCTDPPKTKCGDCGQAHWYFDRDEWGCTRGKGTR